LAAVTSQKTRLPAVVRHVAAGHMPSAHPFCFFRLFLWVLAGLTESSQLDKEKGHFFFSETTEALIERLTFSPSICGVCHG
jgi:hypothetical protein